MFLLLGGETSQERNVALRFALVPEPLLRTALAAGMGWRVIHAIVCLMLPDKATLAALVFVRGRFFILRQPQKFLEIAKLERLLIEVTVRAWRASTLRAACTAARFAEPAKLALASFLHW